MMMEVNIEPPEGWVVVGHDVVSNDESYLTWEGDSQGERWVVRNGVPVVCPKKPRWIVRKVFNPFPSVDCSWVPAGDKTVIGALEYITRCVVTQDADYRKSLLQLTDALKHLEERS